MAPTTRLLLVRHGETLANRDFRYIGKRDDVLTEQGRAQAAALAEALSILPVAAIYSSPRQRTLDTAQPIAERHHLPVQVLPELVEGSFGAWEGLSRAEVLALGAEDELLLHAWEANPEIAPPGGESFAAIQRRVLAAVAQLAQTHPDQTIVLVSHVGPIKILLCSGLGAPLSSLFQIFLDPATISVVDWCQPRPTVRLLNSHAHLGWSHARWMR